MLTEKDARTIAEKVVQAAKVTSNVDTGALKRSISYTYVKGEIIFRQLFYGIYNKNSQLEKYAKKYIPNGQAWKIVLTKFGGETVEIGRTIRGNTTRNVLRSWDSVSAIDNVLRTTTSNIRRLMETRKSRLAREAIEAANGKT